MRGGFAQRVKRETSGKDPKIEAFLGEKEVGKESSLGETMEKVPV